MSDTTDHVAVKVYIRPDQHSALKAAAEERATDGGLRRGPGSEASVSAVLRDWIDRAMNQ